MTKLTTSMAIAVVTASIFASAQSLADEGSYYEGVSPSKNTRSLDTLPEQTRVFGYPTSRDDRHTDDTIRPDNGDFYQGIQRPN